MVTFNASEFGVTAKSILPASWSTADADVQSISLGFNAANANTGVVRDLARDRLRLGSEIFDLGNAATGSFSYTLDDMTTVSLNWAVDNNNVLRLQRSDDAAFTAAQLQAIDRALSFQTSQGAAQGNRSLQWSMSDVAGNTSSVPIVVAAISEPPTLAVAWQAGRQPAAGITGIQADSQPLHHALVFNGHADSYAVQTGLNLQMRKSLSVQAWLNPASLPASGLADIMDISGASNTDRALLALDAQGRLVFQLRQGSQILTHQVSTQALALHSWQHVAVTVADNGELAFWINGQKVASGLAPSNAPANTDYQFDNVVLGHGGFNVLDGRFIGAMRDVRLYDAVASDAQIQSASQDRLDAGAKVNLTWSNSAESEGRDFPPSTTTPTSTLTLGSEVVKRWQDTPLVPPNSKLTLGLPVSTNRVKTITLAFDGLADGSNESLLFQGQVLTTLQASNATGSITFNGGGWNWSWNLASHSLTLTFASGGTTTIAAQDLVQALAYRNDSSTPSVGRRQFSLSLTDLLGNASTTPLTLNLNALNNNDSLSVLDLTTTQNLISITQGATFGFTAPLGAEVQILWQNGSNSVVSSHVGTGGLLKVGLTQAQATALGNGTVNAQVWTRNANGQVASGSDSFNLDVVAPVVPVLASSVAGLNNLDSVNVSMAEAGTVYLVRDEELGQARNLLAAGLDSVNSLATLMALPDDEWNQLSVLAANTPTAFSLQGLVAGTYHLFAADAAGNLSNASANTVLLSTASVLTVQGWHSANDEFFPLGNGTLANGDSLVFSFAPDNPVDLGALPRPLLQFTLNGKTRYAQFDEVNSAPGSQKFTYTPVAGDFSAAGSVNLSTTQNPLLFADRLRVTGTNNAPRLDVAALNTSATVIDLVPDNVAPQVVAMSRSFASGSNYISNTDISFDVVFSEDVTGLDVNDFDIKVGETASTAASILSVTPVADANAANGYASRYTVTVRPASNTTQNNLTISLKTGAVQDAASNSSTSTSLGNSGRTAVVPWCWPSTRKKRTHRSAACRHRRQQQRWHYQRCRPHRDRG